jgi:hypothetical protein
MANAPSNLNQALGGQTHITPSNLNQALGGQPHNTPSNLKQHIGQLGKCFMCGKPNAWLRFDGVMWVCPSNA